MNKKITISYKAFFIMAAVYLALPVIIFFLGYLKLVYGIILTLAMAASLVLAIRDCARDPDGGLVKSKEVEFPGSDKDAFNHQGTGIPGNGNRSRSGGNLRS